MAEKTYPFRRTVDTDRVSARRAIYFALVVGIVFVAVRLFLETWGADESSVLKYVIPVLFTVLLSQVTAGAVLATLGFLQHLRGGDPMQITRIPPSKAPEGDAPEPAPATAIVVPIYNEDVDRVFNGVESMWKDLHKTGKAEGFDFFILSDSNRPESWVREEWAWANLCRKLGAGGRLFYRKRKVQAHGKSGNLADFCQRWGRRYRYMIVLDADSVLTGNCLTQMVATMEKHPQVGLIQTMPWMVLGTSPFRRAFQFLLRVCGPLFAGGANYWQQFSASYWGHNAIIRTQPFIEHCDLPDLPEEEPSKRHILSHDTVEAALMRTAGYEVWMASEIQGSYEEGPPNLSDMMKRDRRWCLGNIQHFWFLFAPGINFANRVHILLGIMSYASSPLWLLTLILGAVDGFYKYRHAWYSALASEPLGLPFPAAMWLLSLTFGLLLAPKILGWLSVLPRAKDFGGVFPLTLSLMIETVFSACLAPVIMLFHSVFVVTSMLGIQVKWGSQNRKDGGLSLGQCIRSYGIVSLIGVAAAWACWRWLPPYFWWFSPIFIAWILAVPMVWISSMEGLGRWLRARGLFLIPEEIHEPEVLKDLERSSVDDFAREGLKSAVEHPLVHALHLALLRQSAAQFARPEVAELIQEKVEEISMPDQMRLLWDAEALEKMHRAHWLEGELNRT